MAFPVKRVLRPSLTALIKHFDVEGLPQLYLYTSKALGREAFESNGGQLSY